MGLGWQSVKWLAWLSRAGGVKFGHALTLGRQNLYMNDQDLGEVLGRFGVTTDEMDRYLKPKPAYAERLFELFGAQRADSMDASTYENATIIHDLNEPLPERLRSRFDLVFDGGTLEHVFNFAEGMRSAMSMVKVGGSFVAHQVFNNMVGHGFCCFGPEVFYRALSEENGFVVKNVRIHERYPRSPWRTLPDPRDLKSRVRVISWGLEVEILVHAVRAREVPIFERWPQQSDYADAWASGDGLSLATNEDRIRLGVNSSGPVGRFKASVLRPLRARSLRSPMLGRLGKYWLNARTFGLRAQRSSMPIDDPFLGGGPPSN